MEVRWSNCRDLGRIISREGKRTEGEEELGKDTLRRCAAISNKKYHEKSFKGTELLRKRVF